MGARKRDGFYKRGKYWWTRDPVHGRRASTGFESLKAAQEWKEERRRLARAPGYAAAQAATIGEWIGRWLKWKETLVAEPTMLIARQKLGHFVRIWGPEVSLAEVTPGRMDSYVAQRRSEEVSDHTISKEVTHVLSVLKLAKRSGCFSEDLATLRPPDLRAGYVPRKRALGRAEVAALLAELPAERAAVVAISIALGCRWSEAMRLLPTDIESDRVVIRGTKTEGSLRTVPILSLYRPLLEQGLPYLPFAPWPNGHKDIFRACKRARIPHCSPNDFRRTHATLLIEAGVDRDVVRRLLGHTTSALVEKVYGQPSIEALGALAEQKLLTVPRLLEAKACLTRSDAKPASTGNETASITGSMEGRSVPVEECIRQSSLDAATIAGSEHRPSSSVPIGSPSSPVNRAFRALAWTWFRKSNAMRLVTITSQQDKPYV